MTLCTAAPLWIKPKIRPPAPSFSYLAPILPSPVETVTGSPAPAASPISMEAKPSAWDNPTWHPEPFPFHQLPTTRFKAEQCKTSPAKASVWPHPAELRATTAQESFPKVSSLTWSTAQHVPAPQPDSVSIGGKKNTFPEKKSSSAVRLIQNSSKRLFFPSSHVCEATLTVSHLELNEPLRRVIPCSSGQQFCLMATGSKLDSARRKCVYKALRKVWVCFTTPRKRNVCQEAQRQ